MLQSQSVRDRIARLEDVPAVADPQLEKALEHDHDLLVGVISARLIAHPAARINHREDHLEQAIKAGGEELIDSAETRIGDPPPLLAQDDPAQRRLLDEQLGDREVERTGDPLDDAIEGLVTSRSTWERKLSAPPARSASSRNVSPRAWRSARIRGPS